MQKIERIQFLTELTIQEPADPFAWYALCLESELEPNEHYFQWLDLLQKFPNYLPIYYQTGMTASKLNKTEEAIKVWKQGIELAKAQNDRHTLAELNSAIQNALLEEDE